MAAAGETTPGIERYLDRPMTPPAPEVSAAIEAGAIDPSLTLGLDELDALAAPAPLPAETGWCPMPDGSGYAAVRTELPGVSAEMVDWWFDWHQRDSLRYRAWFPGAHAGISYTPGPGGGTKAHWRARHHPVEDIGTGMQRLRIDFLSPREFGFASDFLDDETVATVVCGLVGDRIRRMRHTAMAHVFLRGDAGLVQRSRFWLVYALRPYAPKPLGDLVERLISRPAVRRRVMPSETPRAMATHCAAEYANLATLLPELFDRYGDG